MSPELGSGKYKHSVPKVSQPRAVLVITGRRTGCSFEDAPKRLEEAAVAPPDRPTRCKLPVFAGELLEQGSDSPAAKAKRKCAREGPCIRGGGGGR